MSDCDYCHHELSDRRFYLDRTVQVYCYSNEEELVQIQVLYSDSIHHFCSEGCADISVPKALDSLGLKLLPPTINPVGTCSRCNGPVDMGSASCSLQPNGSYPGLQTLAHPFGGTQ
jgi:hypothetical protein